MRQTNKTRSTAITALIITNLIWAFAFPLAKLGYRDGLTPDSLLFYRFLFGFVTGLPILIYLFKTGKIKLKLKDILTISVLEFFGTFLALVLLYQGVKQTSAVESSLIGATLPIAVTIAGIFIIKEKENVFEATGLALSFAGTIFLILQPLLQNNLNGHFSGNLLVLSHNFITAFYYIAAKRYYKKYNMFAVVMIGCFIAGISLLLMNPSNITLLNPNTFLSLGDWGMFTPIYMGILGTNVAISFYLYGQNKIEASEAAMFNYLNPLFAIPLSFFILKETIGVNEIIGGFLILAGLLLAQKRK